MKLISIRDENKQILQINPDHIVSIERIPGFLAIYLSNGKEIKSVNNIDEILKAIEDAPNLS